METISCSCKNHPSPCALFLAKNAMAAFSAAMVAFNSVYPAFSGAGPDYGAPTRHRPRPSTRTLSVKLIRRARQTDLFIKKGKTHIATKTSTLQSPVPYEVARCLIPWECFGDLPRDPLGGWICCHIGPDEPSPLQTQDDQPLEQFEPDRRNDEQIDAGDMGGVIAQESLPARRARAVTP